MERFPDLEKWRQWWGRSIALAVVLLFGSFAPAWPAACQVTATAVNFGNYDPLASLPKEAASQITVRCNHKIDTPATVLVSVSAGGSGNAGERAMTATLPGAILLYNLYANPGMTTVLGDGSGGSEALTNVVDKSAPWIITVYGRIPALQNIPVGTYADSLTVNILY